ncbi:MAG: ABC transporter ATP-binding protein [Spirochaetia bacterium]|nr:ABC transporter ATP-binding protein [Spirochaetia bacterium]
MKYLDIAELRLSRDDFSLELSLSLDRGQTGVIVGPSGCGKTSLLRCIAGLEHPQRGRIWVNGADISAQTPEKRNLGFVFQDLALFDHLDGRGNLEFGLALAGVEKAERKAVCDRLATTLKISLLLGRKPSTMSGGEKQRLAFARALATKPRILLLDEPLSSLDAPLRKELRRYLRTMLKQEGITALHVTHDVEEALDLGDRLFIMNKGRIVARGSPSEILANPPDAWCVNFLGLGLLLPLAAGRSGNSASRFVTAYGTFSPPEKNFLTSSALEREDVFYFIPPKAATLCTKVEFENHEAEGGKNTLYGTVESVSERNGSYRIRLRLAARKGGNDVFDGFSPAKDLPADLGGTIGEPPFIELETTEKPGLVEGAFGYLKIRPEGCALLPGYQTQSHRG